MTVEVVEAMARGMIEAGCPLGIAHDLARAAIRALPPGWVVAKVPEERFLPDADDEEQAYEDGYNDALAAIRASAAEVG